VLGVRVRGAWYDLGSPSTYLAAQLRLLKPQPSLVDSAARVRGRLTLAIVGAGSRVEEGASVVRSVLWDRVRVGAGAVVRDSILASGVRVAPGARVEARVVVPGRGGRSAWTRLR
jgi:NDP-sugar pyrophosphorylase family protein